jgi:transposase
MIIVSPTQKIFVALEPLDFRKGFNGTAGACRQLAQGSHLTGAVFLFLNRSATMMRCYSFDGHGEFLLIKRVARGKFKWWRKNPEKVDPAEVASVLAGAGPLKGLPKPWKPLV